MHHTPACSFMCKYPSLDCSFPPRISRDSSVVVTSIWGSQGRIRYASVSTSLSPPYLLPSPSPLTLDPPLLRPTPTFTIPHPHPQSQTPNTRFRMKVPDPCSPYRSSNPKPKTSSRNSSISSSARANSKSKYHRRGRTRPWMAWPVGVSLRFHSAFFLVFGFRDFVNLNRSGSERRGW